MSKTAYVRPAGAALLDHLREPRRFIQVVSGARQVGKTTLVRQVTDRLGSPARYASADEPGLRGREWIVQQWEAARLLAAQADGGGALLALDEIHKIDGWSETVKGLWDADARGETPLKVVLMASSPLLIQRGLTESLAGRFEVLRLPHWSLAEMRDAFGWSLDQYLFFGAYPGAAPLRTEPDQWARYVLDALVEPTIATNESPYQRGLRYSIHHAIGFLNYKFKMFGL